MKILKKVLLSMVLAGFVLPAASFAAVSVDSGIYASNASSVEYGNTDNRSILSTIALIINWILGLLAALAVLVIIVAGIMYITSGGDEGKVETAKNWIMYAIIGLIIALLGYVIVYSVSGIVNPSEFGDS